MSTDSSPITLTLDQIAAQFDGYAGANQFPAIQGSDYHSGAVKGYTHAAAFLREFGVLRWFSELPTKPGYYWRRHKTCPEVKWVEEIWVKDGVSLLADPDGGSIPLRQALGWALKGEWAGPIQTPSDE